jgi:hypothetical protein
MSNKGKKIEAEPEVETTAETVQSGHAAIDQATASQGRRARASFMLKNFVDRDWIMKNVVAKGKDEKTGKYARVPVGRVYGIVSSTSLKKGTLPDGSVSESVVLNGIFETESLVDGEVSAPTSLYLPNAFSRQIEAVFAADKTVNAVKIDVDIDVEATGKGIPYTWVVVNHIDTGKSPLEDMKNARKRLAAPAAPKQLTAG